MLIKVGLRLSAIQAGFHPSYFCSLRDDLGGITRTLLIRTYLTYDHASVPIGTPERDENIPPVDRIKYIPWNNMKPAYKSCTPYYLG